MRRQSPRFFSLIVICGVGAAICAWGQTIPRTPAPVQAASGRAAPADAQHDEARDELRRGTELTRSGALGEAIPHLLAAQAAGADAYATGVNLAICYVGIGANAKAIPLLESLRSSGYRTATTATLLVQAYIAGGRLKEAYELLSAAADTAPPDEKMFAYAADACTDSRQYALGLRMMNLGLKELPASARLHYEKALFLAQLGSIEEARPEFDRAAALDSGGYIGDLARVQKDLYNDDLKAADEILERAVHSGRRDYRLLSLLGTVLLQEGAAPGDARFAEARAALEESARERPDFSATQIALGKIDSMLGQYRDAVQHLEIGRALEPMNPAVYAGLASAYRHLGEREKASQASMELGRLVRRQNGKSPVSAPSAAR